MVADLPKVTEHKWTADPAQMARAMAAQDLLNAGKPMAEVVEAIRGKTKRVRKSKPKAVETGEPASEDEAEKYRDYLEAVCRLGHGRFAHLSRAELLKAARLVPFTVRSFEQWAQDDE